MQTCKQRSRHNDNLWLLHAAQVGDVAVVRNQRSLMSLNDRRAHRFPVQVEVAVVAQLEVGTATNLDAHPLPTLFIAGKRSPAADARANRSKCEQLLITNTESVLPTQMSSKSRTEIPNTDLADNPSKRKL